MEQKRLPGGLCAQSSRSDEYRIAQALGSTRARSVSTHSPGISEHQALHDNQQIQMAAQRYEALPVRWGTVAAFPEQWRAAQASPYLFHQVKNFRHPLVQTFT